MADEISEYIVRSISMVNHGGEFIYCGIFADDWKNASLRPVFLVETDFIEPHDGFGFMECIGGPERSDKDPDFLKRKLFCVP